MKSHASMNRIYRLVFNAALGLWVAVAENAKGRGKGGRAASALLAVLAILSPAAYAANAADATLRGGTGTVTTLGTTTTINQTSQRMALDWTQLNTAANEALVFSQPNAQAIALNRITGSSPSSFLGSLTANGQVFILNPNGILFGAGSQVNVAGIVASTLGMNPADFMNGSNTFTKTTGTGSVVNQGSMTAANGGYLALLAPEVRNEGVMTATLGTALLAAGNKVTLNLNNGSLLSYSIDQGAINALAENKQLIKADGGQVLLSARAMDALTTATVNNTGVIEAKTIQNIAGRVMLIGDMEYGTLNADGRIDVSAPNGGDGGFVETSAANVKIASAFRVNSLSDSGKHGKWLIDPTDFTISAGAGGQTTSDIGADTLVANLNLGDVSIATAAAGTGNGDIFVNSAVSTNSVQWTAGTSLTLNAHGNIVIRANLGPNTTYGSSSSVIKLIAGGDVRRTASGVIRAGTVRVKAGGNVGLFDLGANLLGAGFWTDNLTIEGAGTGEMSINASRFTSGSPVFVAIQSGGSVRLRPDTSSLASDFVIDTLLGATENNVSGIQAVGAVDINYSTAIGRGITVNAPITSGSRIDIVTTNAGATISGSAAGNGGDININSRLNAQDVSLTTGNGGNANGAAGGIGFNGGRGGNITIGSNQTFGSNMTVTTGNGGSASLGSPTSGNGGAGGSVLFNAGSMQFGNLSLTPGTGGSRDTGAPNGGGSNGAAGSLGGNNVTVVTTGSIATSAAIRPDSGTTVNLSAATGINNGAGGAVVVDATQLNLRNTTSGNVLANNTGNITITGNSNVGRMQLASSTGDITLNGTVNATAAGDAIVLAANKKLVNNAGSGALTVANGGRWLVWSQTPVANTFGGLQSGNAAMWNTAFNPASPTVGGTGNQFIFSDAGPGVGVVKASNASKTYGDAFAGSFGYTAVVAGGEDFGNAYTDARGAAIALGGTAPVLASSGAAATATRTGGNSGGAGYDINVDITGATAAGYTLQAAKGTLTVDARAINISGGRVYDGTTGVAGGALVAGNTRNGDAITLTGAGSMADKNAGNGKALGLGTLALGGSGAANYTLAGGTAAVDISRANLSLTTNAVTKTYDGGLTAAGTAVATGGTQFFGTDAVSGGTFAFTDKNFGLGNKTVATSGVTVNDGNGGNNYNVSYVNNTGSTIDKAALTVTANNDSKVAGSPAYSGGNGVTYAGLVVGDTAAGTVTGAPSYSGTSQGATAVGSYAITPGGLTLASTNYTLGYANGVLNITAAPPKVVAPVSAVALALGEFATVRLGFNPIDSYNSAQNSFQTSFKNDIATALNIDVTRISIQSLNSAANDE